MQLIVQVVHAQQHPATAAARLIYFMLTAPYYSGTSPDGHSVIRIGETVMWRPFKRADQLCGFAVDALMSKEARSQFTDVCKDALRSARSAGALPEIEQGQRANDPARLAGINTQGIAPITQDAAAAADDASSASSHAAKAVQRDGDGSGDGKAAQSMPSTAPAAAAPGAGALRALQLLSEPDASSSNGRGSVRADVASGAAAVATGVAPVATGVTEVASGVARDREASAANVWQALAARNAQQATWHSLHIPPRPPTPSRVAAAAYAGGASALHSAEAATEAEALHQASVGSAGRSAVSYSDGEQHTLDEPPGWSDSGGSHGSDVLSQAADGGSGSGGADGSPQGINVAWSAGLDAQFAASRAPNDSASDDDGAALPGALPEPSTSGVDVAHTTEAEESQVEEEESISTAPMWRGWVDQPFSQRAVSAARAPLRPSQELLQLAHSDAPAAAEKVAEMLQGSDTQAILQVRANKLKETEEKNCCPS